MAVFTVFELKGGWIQGLGRIEFKEFPTKGKSVKIPSFGIADVRWYEVLYVEPTTDSTSVGDVVVTLKLCGGKSGFEAGLPVAGCFWPESEKGCL